MTCSFGSAAVRQTSPQVKITGNSKKLQRFLGDQDNARTPEIDWQPKGRPGFIVTSETMRSPHAGAASVRNSHVVGKQRTMFLVAKSLHANTQAA